MPNDCPACQDFMVATADGWHICQNCGHVWAERKEEKAK